MNSKETRASVMNSATIIAIKVYKFLDISIRFFFFFYSFANSLPKICRWPVRLERIFLCS